MAILLLFGSVVTAAPTDEPHFVDPAGDATWLQTAPVPAGAEAWDLVAGRFHDETPHEVTLTIQVVAADGPPPSGEVGVTFLAPDGPRIAGYTVVPGVYSGGFLCTSDENGDVRAADGQSCDGIPATFTADEVVVTLNRTALNASRLGDALVAPWGWSEAYASNGDDWRFDRTDVGRDHVFASGVSNETGAPDNTAPADPEVGAQTPAPGVLGVLLAVTALAAAKRRR